MVTNTEMLAELGEVQIYALIDPRTDEIRYVGKTSDFRKRMRAHMVDSVLNRYRDKRTSWLKSLKSEGLKPIVRILESVSADQWEACERKWISHYRAIGARLTNTLDGGDGRSKGCRMPADAVEKTAAKLRGRKRSTEVIENVRAAMVGRVLPVGKASELHSNLRRWWTKMTPAEKTAKLAKTREGSLRHALATNAHGQLGISWSEGRQKWVAYINFSGKRIPLGRFSTREEAIDARRSAEIKYLETSPHSEP